MTRLIRLLMHPWFMPACFIVFIGIRLALILSIPVDPTSDAAWYQQRAADIASGVGYMEDGYPTAYWPVGYPGFLALIFSVFGPHVIAGQLTNLALAAGSFFLLFAITKRLFKNELASRLALVLITFYPNNIAYTALLLTETFFTFLILLGFYLYLRYKSWRWILLTGLIFGYAALTKPQIVFLPGLMILFSLLDKNDARKPKQLLLNGALLYTAMAMVLIPWAVRNTLAFHEVVLVSTNGGAALLIGNNPSADGGDISNDSLLKQRRWSVADQVASDKRARALAVQWIKDNPGRFMELIPIKIWHLWIKDGDAEWAYQGGYANYDKYKLWFRGVRVINQVYYYFLLIACIISMLWMRNRRHEIRWPWSLFGYFFLAYTTFLCAIFSGQIRYHFPVMPWIIMYAAWALAVYVGKQQSIPHVGIANSDAEDQRERTATSL